MEPKTRQATLIELHDQTLWKLLEATAMVRVQQKEAAQHPEKVIKEIMDPRTMQMRGITITEMLGKNMEAKESMQNLLTEIEAMMQEDLAQA